MNRYVIGRWRTGGWQVLDTFMQRLSQTYIHQADASMIADWLNRHHFWRYM